MLASDSPASQANSQPHPAFILGAYASLPATAPERAEYYEHLATIAGVRGLELPYRDDLGGPDSLPTLASQLAPAWDRNIVTAIPGTMMRVWADPAFGLASTLPEGRQAALAFTAQVRDAVCNLHELAGRAVVAGVEVHSAPTGPHGQAHSAAAFRESLTEILSWDWQGATILVEHCDAWVSDDRGEKRFLTLEEEIEVVRALRDAGQERVAMSLNWGRSALEARDAATPARHVRAAREAGILAGLTFSGAGPADTPYAAAWMDGHLPLAADEPGSVMGAAEVAECARLACSPRDDGQTAAWYLGVKCQVPAQAGIQERAGYLKRILTATGF